MSEAEKRSVSTDALETLGTIIGDNEKRDAIHLAVEPTTAQENLFPGQDVGVDGTTNNPVGIVDPFLKIPVVKGEKFWLVVYPRQIKSLRHVWSHPSFTDEIDRNPGTPATNSLPPRSYASISEEWIRNYANSIDLTYNVLMRGAKDWLDHGEYLVMGGLLEGVTLPDEFWIHYENITNETVALENRDSFFSCSC